MAYQAYHVVRQKTKPPPPPTQPPNIVLMDTEYDNAYEKKNREFLRKEIAAEDTSSTDLVGPPAMKKRRISLLARKGKEPIVLLDPDAPFERFGDEPVSFRWPTYTLLVCLILCAVLHAAVGIASLIVWFNIYFTWPLRFIAGFHPLSFLFVNKWIGLILFACEPFYNLIMLIMMVLVWGKKRPHFIRLYCWIHAWFLFFMCLVITNCIYFLTGISLKKINDKLSSTMQLYYKDPAYISNVHHDDIVARNGWNELQFYLQCCGIVDYLDWSQISLHEVEGVPISCCRSTAICLQEDIDITQNVWPVGCNMKTFDLFTHAARVVLIVALFSFIVSTATVYFSRLKYISERSKTDKTFNYHMCTFMSDVFCCGFYAKLCHRKKHHNKIQSNLIPNPIYPQQETSLPLPADYPTTTTTTNKHEHKSVILLYENKNFTGIE